MNDALTFRIPTPEGEVILRVSRTKETGSVTEITLPDGRKASIVPIVGAPSDRCWGCVPLNGPGPAASRPSAAAAIMLGQHPWLPLLDEFSDLPALRTAPVDATAKDAIALIRERGCDVIGPLASSGGFTVVVTGLPDQIATMEERPDASDAVREAVRQAIEILNRKP